MSILQEPALQSGTSYLVTIGIDKYRHCARLTNAVRDAQAFANLLTTQYQFESQHVTELYDDAATKGGITDAFRMLVDKVHSDRDNVVVYYSGHGHYDKVLDEAYWIPVEAQYRAEVDYISYSYLTKLIKALHTRHTLFIVDSCYSGVMLVRSRDTASERLEQDPSRWMLASGRNEVVPDGPAGGNSPFAEELLGILSRYKDQPLRISVLVDKLMTAVTYNSEQTPIGRPIYAVGDKGGEFVFHPKNMATQAAPRPSVSENMRAQAPRDQRYSKVLKVLQLWPFYFVAVAIPFLMKELQASLTQSMQWFAFPAEALSIAGLMYVAIRYFRDKHAGGSLSINDGALLTLIISVFINIGWAIITTWRLGALIAPMIAGIIMTVLLSIGGRKR